MTISRPMLIAIVTAIWCGMASAAETEANAVFLVASRGLADPNFRETVVLVTHPQRGGPWGVIINRPLGHPLSEVFPEQASLKGRKDVLHFGGPVARQRLVVLVRTAKPPPGATAFLRDVYTTADTNWIDGHLKRPDPTKGLKVFAGHSGWAAGQLQSEIRRGGWHVLPADAETLFDKDPATIWPELIERATTKQTRNTGRAGGRENGRWESASFENAGDSQCGGSEAGDSAFATSRPPDLPISRLFDRFAANRH